MRGDRSGGVSIFGRALGWVLGLCLFVMVAAGGFAEERIVYVESDIYSSDLLVTTDSSQGPVSVTLSNCQTFAIFAMPVRADETVIVEDIAQYQCAGPVGLISPAYDGPLGASAKIRTLVTFADELGNLAAFEIPALRHSLDDYVLEAEGIRNDETYDTAVILFNEFEGLLYVKATVYDQDNQVAGRETIELPGRSHVLTNLKTFVQAGRVEVSPGVAGFGCPGCDASGPVYGFVTVNWREGGSPRVVPLEPVRYSFAIE